ncbi:MAG: hypothetical protein ACPG19_10110 [Saprospiraceae bacterium]
MNLYFKQLILFTLFSLFYSNTIIAQNISGEWNGVIKQDEGGLSDQYIFSIHIIQDGKKITGFTKVELYRSTKRILYARKRITGTFEGKVLKFQEVEIVDLENASSSNICLVKGKLKFVWDKSALCLEGTWGGKTSDGTICAPGKIKVCSTIPIAN